MLNYCFHFWYWESSFSVESFKTATNETEIVAKNKPINKDLVNIIPWKVLQKIIMTDFIYRILIKFILFTNFLLFTKLLSLKSIFLICLLK